MTGFTSVGNGIWFVVCVTGFLTCLRALWNTKEPVVWVIDAFSGAIFLTVALSSAHQIWGIWPRPAKWQNKQ